jgi:uncharacterized protein YkuJ
MKLGYTRLKRRFWIRTVALLLFGGGIMSQTLCYRLPTQNRARLINRSLIAFSLLIATAQISTAQMSVPGKSAINSNGAATYSIPIAAPPGTAGMSPSLSLDYNSQGGDGIVGLGWTLSGLPVVGRCPETVTQDGVSGAITYGTNDRFCLDGQRLMAISGTYGADGTQYRTEVESFSEVISHGTAGTGPAWFEVHTKAGHIMEFGHTSDSQILAQGQTTVRSWALDKASDTKGNYFTVTYTNDATNGQAYPQRIDYTGNAAAGLSTYNSLQFAYVTRSDIPPFYQAGSMINTAVLLSTVKTYAGTTLVGTYTLGYQQSAGIGRSLLANVTLCGADGTCLPANNFTWTSGDNFSLTAKPQVIPIAGGWTPPDSTYSWADMNGDGKADQVTTYQNENGTIAVSVSLSNGDGTFTVKPYTVPFSTGYYNWYGWGYSYADVNGDGKADLIMTYQGSNGMIAVSVALSNGDGTFTVKPEVAPFSSGYYSWYGWSYSYQDINGDGKADLVMTYQGNNGPGHNGEIAVSVALSNGDGSFTVEPEVAPFASGWAPGTSYPSWQDINGDGKADLVMTYQDTNGTVAVAVALSNGDGTFTVKPEQVVFASGYIPWGWSSTWTDVNGDGKADLVMTYQDSNGLTCISVVLSNGDGTFTVKPETCPFSSGYPPPSGSPSDGSYVSGWSYSWQDMNGDGKADLVLTYQDVNSGEVAVRVLLSKGDGTFAVQPQTVLFASGYTQPTGSISDGSAVSGWTYTWADLNGDGKADLALTYQDVNSGEIAVGSAVSSSSPLAVQNVNTGLAATTLTYATLGSAGALYSQDTNAVYPTRDFGGATFVVSRIDASNGTGGLYSTTYGYAGAKVDLSGRGFLGFRQVTSTDLQTNVVETINYLQTYPFIAEVANDSKKLGSTTLTTTANTYASTALGGTRYQVLLSQTQTSGTDLDGSALPTTTTAFTYDAYNNATQIAASVSDGSSKTTTNTFTNDTTNWFLGRLTASSVTSQTP